MTTKTIQTKSASKDQGRKSKSDSASASLKAVKLRGHLINELTTIGTVNIRIHESNAEQIASEITGSDLPWIATPVQRGSKAPFVDITLCPFPPPLKGGNRKPTREEAEMIVDAFLQPQMKFLTRPTKLALKKPGASVRIQDVALPIGIPRAPAPKPLPVIEEGEREFTCQLSTITVRDGSLKVIGLPPGVTLMLPAWASGVFQDFVSCLPPVIKVVVKYNHASCKYEAWLCDEHTQMFVDNMKASLDEVSRTGIKLDGHVANLPLGAPDNDNDQDEKE